MLVGGRIEVAEDGFWTGEAGDVFGGSDGEDFAASNGHGFHGAGLVIGESFAGVDDAVEEDDVGRR